VLSETSKSISQFSELALELAAAPDEDARLKLGVGAAMTLIVRCDHAGITINDKRVLVTRASSDEVVQRANALQHELGEGPCLDVMRDQNTVVSTSLQHDQRWPTWAPRVHAELGVDSMMSLLVFTDRVSFGALSLYARDGERFDADDVAVGQALAAQLAVIMSAERQIDQLGLGMRNRIIIGQAQGILMERLDITADQAFDYLRRASMHTNRKVVEVANEIAGTRKLPDLT
jgi:transcriptional regulator with GAF, ATPase, and Fis domain